MLLTSSNTKPIIDKCKEIFMLTRSMSRLVRSTLFTKKRVVAVVKKHKSISEIPTEMKFYLFNSLSIKELSRLSLSAKHMCTLIKEYVCLKSTMRRLMPEVHCHFSEDNLDSFKQLGILLKRLTIVLPTSERLDFIVDFIKNNMCHPKEKCSYHPNCTSNQMLGHLLKMFCSGWSMDECRQLYRNINSIQPSVLVEVNSPFNLKEKNIEPILLRIFNKELFLEPHILRSEWKTWLSILSKENCSDNDMVTHFLYILYGPIVNGELLNDSLSTFSLDVHSTTLRMMDLGSCLDIYSLILENPDNIVDIVFRMTKMGNIPWSDDRLSHFVYMCGRNITVSVMRYLIVKQKRVGNMLASLIYVTMQYADDVRWAVNLLPEIVIHTHKKYTVTDFYYGVVDSCQERIHNEIIRNRDTDMTLINELLGAMSALTKEYMIKALDFSRPKFATAL